MRMTKTVPMNGAGVRVMVVALALVVAAATRGYGQDPGPRRQGIEELVLGHAEERRNGTEGRGHDDCRQNRPQEHVVDGRRQD